MTDWMDSVESHHRELRDETHADIAELRQEMHAQFSNAREEMRTGFARLEASVAKGQSELLRWTVAWVVAVAGVAVIATAAHSQARPPVRPLGAIFAKSTATFDSLVNVRALSDGRVVVNDIIGRRLVSLDPTLEHLTRIADTAAGAPKPYSDIAVIPFTGDSLVVVDFRSSALLVLEPSGTFGRSMALAKASDMQSVAISSVYGSPAFDPPGSLVYRGGAGGAPLPLGCVSPAVRSAPLDSSPLVRANFDTRAVDTVTKVKFVIVRGDFSEGQPGCWRAQRKLDVLPHHGDEWVVLADGTIAIVREQDYHVDWIAMDGARTSTPKMPFDWRALSIDDKQRMIDSVKHIEDSTVAARPIPAGSPRDFKWAPARVVEQSEIPDYYPPVKLGSVKVDLDGNLWIPPSTSRDAKGGVLYDVVNRKGEVFDRVQLPAGRAIIGFARDGVLLLHREGGRMTVEKARLR